jgi:hypothetical protein
MPARPVPTIMANVLARSAAMERSSLEIIADTLLEDHALALCRLNSGMRF